MRVRRLLAALFAGAIGALALVPPAAAQEPPTVTTVVNHSSTVKEFPAYCGFPASTEYATGTEHLQVAVLPSGTLQVTYSETFEILEVSSDPAVPPRERKGTDALTFHLINNGPKIFHESYHENNTVFGDIFLTTTFVAIDGEVLVDHNLGRNLPPEGC
jgi:hypothetical protein